MKPEWLKNGNVIFWVPADGAMILPIEIQSVKKVDKYRYTINNIMQINFADKEMYLFENYLKALCIAQERVKNQIKKINDDNPHKKAFWEIYTKYSLLIDKELSGKQIFRGD